MLVFIKSNIDSILVALVVILGLLFLYKNGKKEVVREIVLSLVVKAEKALGSGMGELQYAMVVEGIYDKLPKLLTALMSKKEIDREIKKAVKKMKDYLSKGNKDLLGYDEEYMRQLKFNQ